jgi:arylsulfatase A-like enzyme
MFTRRRRLVFHRTLGMAVAFALHSQPVWAACTQRQELIDLRASIRQAAACSGKRLVSGSGVSCANPQPPSCAGSAVAETIALMFGDVPPTGVGASTFVAQVRCQKAIARAGQRYLTQRVSERRKGQRSQLGSSQSFAPVWRHCAVTAVGAQGVGLPALGATCAGALPPPGEVVDPERLVTCLRPALERIVNTVLGETIRPNIILVVTDDQRWDTLGAMDNVVQRIANQGISFSNGFATTPLCVPSRASLLTGLYAHNHGVPGNNVLNFNDSATLATWLNDQGYVTGLFGKYMNNYEELSPYVPPGWDEWHAIVETNHGFYDYTLNRNGQLQSYGNSDADYSTDVVRDLAVSFIHENANQPFFALYTPGAPHGPEIPAPRHIGAFSGLPPWRPPSWNEPDVSDKPNWIKFSRFIYDPATEPVLDQRRIDQLETLLSVDEAVGAFLAAIESLGLRDNTVVVFTSDHGTGWGEHWWWGKEAAYEELARVPLAMRYPLLAPAPRSEDGFVLNIDLAPTLAELAGVSPVGTVNGTSLIGLLDGSTAERQDFLIEYAIGFLVPGYAAIRTHEWKYIENHDSAEFKELYDLVNDPYELENLAGDSAHAATIETLSERIGELLAE